MKKIDICFEGDFNESDNDWHLPTETWYVGHRDMKFSSWWQINDFLKATLFNRLQEVS